MSSWQSRAVIGLVAIVAIVAILVAADLRIAANNKLTSLSPNVYGTTWYGPVLLLTIPATIVWMFATARAEGARIAGYVLASIVLAACLFIIWLGYQVAWS